ncbi:hypothetical protein [Nocardia terpenica]|uniref:Uncharacterized protein n=1 Tax=Nocardia terpenica TaxID=455432 RepID=A0A164H2S5_9NOCA|nr:hypothetical protein [Nocardia terpenica]KZM68150.1 hypothetical protein AWN90_09420 [Nocardia terpenica]NQE88990.1 hypothetical protein [Nocardia terpenica]
MDTDDMLHNLRVYAEDVLREHDQLLAANELPQGTAGAFARHAYTLAHEFAALDIGLCGGKPIPRAWGKARTSE